MSPSLCLVRREERSSRLTTPMRSLTECRMPSAGFGYQQRKEALMVMTLDDSDTETVSEECAAGMMHAVADRLQSKGLDLRFPNYEEGRCLSIANAKGARSDITVEDCGYVLWEYWPLSQAKTNPADIAAVALGVLGGNITGPGPSANPKVALKGAVGRELEDRRMSVTLAVYEDEKMFEVMAEIMAVNPNLPELGRVFVTDEGSITWEYHNDGPRAECALAVADTIVPILVHGIEGCWFVNTRASLPRRPASSLDAARVGPNENQRKEVIGEYQD